MTRTVAPTNTDIVKLLIAQHDEVQDRLKAVENQVKYTNGQVRSLQEWRSNQEAVEKYKQTATPTVSVTTNPTDWPKILLTVLGLLGTALAIIATVVAK